ncbi:membrane protein implicated in regulation of membrane protease activity [Streptosporangium becharense]|uniref:Membrane protein implicated in regulation of membrane protease activity n=1 Tax=Streptosporangium becharense TaxID=1816182 RepID=A0A7W9IFY9_9ACTN|nr:phage holin family protein [Streptosporangium becharense]MBB2908960.1 membrane protein implicated in regulation of membrane protease activity [Streptosporangium becharense]MBB5820022.1 membrane protein implicated in regulation of membrane protease activity [Streptosporangium becharense]
MTENPPAEPQEESLGALVAAASDHISTLVRAEIELAKAEFRFDAKRVGMAAGLFGAAAFMGHLCLILASFAIAYGLVALGVWTWLAFTIVTVFYLIVAGLLVFVGIRRLKGLTGMKRTLRSLKTIKSGETAPGLPTPAAPPTAGQVGSHREPVRPTR